MIAVEGTRVQELRASFRGDLISPEDDGYDLARKVWNGMIDRRPALIARCSGVADVIAAVNFARGNGLPVSVRCGGHNVAGSAVCDDGVVIDLKRMNSVRVDPAARTARAGGGATWGDFDRETQVFDLASTGGLISTTGIGGLTLGGGIGWLAGKHGLACDNLISADVVAAEGRLLTASAKENEDLFWAIRGGGGNFGVVTSFEYQLHPVGPMVFGGMIAYPLEKTRDVLRLYRQLIGSIPEEMTVYCGVTGSPEGELMVVIVVAYFGPPAEGERLVRPLREFGPPLMDALGPLPYTALQQMLDETAPPGELNYWKSDFLSGLSDEALEIFAAHATTMPSPRTLALIEHLHGAYNRQNSGAFAQRGSNINVVIASTWTDAADTERNIQWTRDFAAALKPFSTGGVYVNYLGDEGEERARAAYGASYERLAMIKQKFDPANLFRSNQNIKPAGR